MADTLFAYGRAISQNNYANKLRMLKLLHLVLRPYQIARKCCICLRNVDLAKGRKEMEGEKNPCVGKNTNCRQCCWRLCSEAALSGGLLKEQRQKAGLLTFVSE